MICPRCANTHRETYEATNALGHLITASRPCRCQTSTKWTWWALVALVAGLAPSVWAGLRR